MRKLTVDLICISLVTQFDHVPTVISVISTLVNWPII